jgi:hypothetical protein
MEKCGAPYIQSALVARWIGLTNLNQRRTKIRCYPWGEEEERSGNEEHGGEVNPKRVKVRLRDAGVGNMKEK